MYARFTDRVRQVMQLANQEAQRFNHEYVGTEHLLLGLIREGSGVAANVLQNMNIDLKRVRREVEKLVQSGPEMVTMGKLPPTPRAKKVLEYAMEESRNLNHNYVGTEHLLLGIAREREGVAAEVLDRLGASLQSLREEVLSLLGHATEDLAAYGSERGARREPVDGTYASETPEADRQNVLRILDASANRAAEGLRVIEDYLRFVLDDAVLTGKAKRLRHVFAEGVALLGRGELIAARDTPGDVGVDIKTPAELVRDDAADVLDASFQRAKQALRSLGEYGKVVNADAAPRFEAARYELYALESVVWSARNQRARLAGVRLYVVVDGLATRESFLVLVDQLLAAGVHAIQLRDKSLADRELVERARTLRRRIRHFDARTLLIMNDRPDLAVLADADGVHVGQEELSVADARKIVGGNRLVGVSTHSIAQARAAIEDGASYIGVGPTFPSQTKHFDDFPGLPLAGYAARELRIPAFAIGGITLENLRQVLATGIERVAVGAAITQSSDPAGEARRWLEALSSS